MSADRTRKRLEKDLALAEASLSSKAVPVGRPALVLLSGLPGAGKSHFARALAERRRVMIIESDAVRKALVARPTYSRSEHARVFSVIHELAERRLRAGVSVLIDATSLREAHRRPVYEIAERAGAGLIVVQLVAPEAVALQRLGERQGDGDAKSDAGPEVYALLREEVDPIGVPHITVDTSRDIGPALDAIAAELQAIEESR